MKKVTLIFLLLASASLLTAQYGSSIEWGTVMQKNNKNDRFMGVTAYTNHGIYGLRNIVVPKSASPYQISHYNSKLEIINQGMMNLGDKKMMRKLEKVVCMNGNVYVFSSWVDKKAKMNFLYCQTLDQSSTTLSTEVRTIASMPIPKKYSSWFDVIVARDSSTLLVYTKYPAQEGQPNEKLNLQVFDEEMQLLWKKDEELPYADNLFYVSDYEVDNNGNVYVVGKLYNEVPKNVRRGDINYRYVIVALYDEGERIKKYDVNVDGKFITDIRLEIMKNGNLICAGFYSEVGTFSIKGTYFLVVDRETGSKIKLSVKDFSLNFITQNFSDKEVEKTQKAAEKGKNVELYEYDLDDLHLMENGSIVMVAEQYFVRVVSSYNPQTRTTTYTYYYYYNDIITIFISPEGKIESMVKIPKRQVSTNDGGPYSSYAMCTSGDACYFVFNDHPDNLNVQEGDAFKYMGRGDNRIPVVVKVTANGTYEKKKMEVPVEDPSDMLILVPKQCNQYSPKHLLLVTNRKKNEQLAIMKFK